MVHILSEKKFKHINTAKIKYTYTTSTITISYTQLYSRQEKT
jgi:hypothetical protein